MNKYSNCIIVGPNGSGKSTILDAITFALFGKPFRNINKPTLVNSVNNKDCVTEIEFSINEKNYKVVRGIKPAIFEIYMNDVCLNQNSSSKDYQEHLEKNILRMSHKSFCQIVILGSASFTPFMHLTPAERRVIIEDLLDIQVFSVMNTLVKLHLQQNKEQFEKIKIENLGKKEKKDYIEKILSSMKDDSDKQLAVIKVNLFNSKEKRKNEETRKEELVKEIERIEAETSNITSLKDKQSKFVVMKAKIQTNHERIEEEISFYKEQTSCHACKQDIDEQFSLNKQTELTTKLSDIQKGIADIENKIDDLKQQIDSHEQKLKTREKLLSQLSEVNSNIYVLNNMISELEKSIEENINNNERMKGHQDELVTLSSSIEENETKQNKLMEERKYIETAITLLKDGGIKTKIVKQYLPIINKLINKYLSHMGFFVQFEINENFEETIKSRYRDTFSYENFSEGEKTRIDLALLFAWRTIAKMRNSVNCSILFFDEIFDGSLDLNGTDEFIRIITEMIEDTNIFIISHKTDQLLDKFQKSYTFSKTKNFSVMR